ncbi:MAG: polysaccharide biosynthesis tyrosine autokinase [Minwuia sp.]|nr:polysaccharide biosynthesis tyrosine autokinase [Minwuia sp.]
MDDSSELPPFMAQSGNDQSLISFRHVFGVIWRRKFIIVAIMMLMTAIAYYWVTTRIPLYVASAEVEIGIQDQRVVNIQDVLQQGQQDFYFNETQAAIISSSFAAEEVAERLGLFDDPSALWWGDQNKASLLGSVKAAIKSVLPDPVVDGVRGALNTLRGGSQESPQVSVLESMTAEERADFERQSIVKGLLGNLGVDPSERARTISISFVSDKPAFAREVANAFAEVYVDSTRTEKSEATSNASSFLGGEAESLKSAYLASEKALEQFRRDNGVVDYRNQTTLLQEQLAELTRQRFEARELEAEAAARVSQVKRLLSEGADGIESVTAVLDSTLIVRLREQETEVLREIAELRTQLREQHPRLQLKRAELQDLQSAIRSEITKIVVALDNKLELTRIKTENLNTEIEALALQVAEQTDSEVTLRSLESERNAAKQLYDTILSRFKEVDLQERSPQQASARVINSASTPLEPSFPRRSLTIAAALVGSAILGVLVVFLIEYMDTGFRSLQQLQQLAYVPALGLVPRLSILDGRRSTPEDFVIDEPNSLYSEAIRTIRTSLMLSSVDQRPRSVMFTSSVPAEGKTSTAVSVARASAKAGQRTILIDCDLRKPSVNESLGVPNGKGVAEILTGATEIDDAVEIDLKSGLHYITAGAKVPNPPDALGSNAMRQLIEELTRRYDLVVLDTPPVLPVSDALVLLRHVDKSVFLVRWGSTRREAVLAGIRQVQEANGDLAGVVMTRVDIRRHQKYNYSDSYYYYRGYGKYYGT